jgi:hypothetical protein
MATQPITEGHQWMYIDASLVCFSECVITEVIAECVIPEVLIFHRNEAGSLKDAGPPGVRNECAFQNPIAQFPKARTNYFAGSNSGLSDGSVPGLVAGNEEGLSPVVAGAGIG